MNLFLLAAALAQAGELRPCAATAKPYAIGREAAIARHLDDGEEYCLPLADLLSHGQRLFSANWTIQEGAGRPRMKGNSQTLTDPSRPLVGTRSFNRFSAPDANSCAGCHNLPYGIIGGGGDFVANVFVLGQRFDFVTFDPADKLATKGALDENGRQVSLLTVGNTRATTGLFGAGYLELLARELTRDLQIIRDSVGPNESKLLLSKNLLFGRISRTADGRWVTKEVEGLPRQSLVSPDPLSPPTLVIRPWHQAGNVVSLREFTYNAMHHHHGMQSTERFGRDTDPDGDGFRNELTRADITAISLWEATLQPPGRVIPRDAVVEKAVLLGERLFEQIGCAACHVPRLPLDKSVFEEPNPFNPAGNLRTGEAKLVRVDLNSGLLPGPRLPSSGSTLWVSAYTDFKLHDITSGPEDPNAEALDMNQTNWTMQFHSGNRRFLTKRLWGAANEPPYFHHGRFTTMREAILAHAGEALAEGRRFEALEKGEQNALVEFLKTLQVLPQGTKALIVDEYYRPRTWPP